MSDVVEYDFFKVVQSTISSVVQYVDDNYSDFLIDIEERDEVLKIDLVEQKKVFVINKNSYLKELWYSSPVSGPLHFKYDVFLKKWIAKNFEFFTLLYSEIESILGID